MLHLISIVAALVALVRADGLNPQSKPASDEVITAEKPYTITWEPGTPGPVYIQLHYAETSAVNITQSTDNSGTYTWTPSGVFDGKTNYFLSICDLKIQNECTYTLAGRFAISSTGTISTTSSSRATVPSSSSAPTSSPSVTATNSVQSPTPVPATSASATSSIPASTSSSNAPASSGGLSSSATTAIAVVFAVVGTALLGLGLFFWYKRRQRRYSDHVATTVSGSAAKEWRGELHGQSHGELDGASQTYQAVELSGHGPYTDGYGHTRHELPDRVK
ncbi:hypothetical protein ACN47E_006241 [Coniothyrium glycines]